MIPFLLNLPYTLVGVFLATLLIPKSIDWNTNPMAFVVRVRASSILDIGYMKGWRGMAVGHVVILNPREEPKDLEHELIHVEQNVRAPLVQPFLNAWELRKKGYRNSKYEVEAYERAGNVYRGKEAAPLKKDESYAVAQEGE